MKKVFICRKCCESYRDKPCKFVIHDSDRVEYFKEYPRRCPMENTRGAGEWTGEVPLAEWEMVE